MKTLAERLRHALDTAHPKRIKNIELANAVGVSPPSVSDWLTGKSKTMEGENLLRAARYLKVNPIWLATGVGAKGVGSPETTNVTFWDDDTPLDDDEFEIPFFSKIF